MADPLRDPNPWLDPEAALRPFAAYAAALIGAVAVVIALWGVGAGLVHLVRMEWARLTGRDPAPEGRKLRHLVGFYMLLTLNILVASDIIETIVLPTLQHLAVLGGVLLIRILTSLSLARELGEGARTHDLAL